MTCDVEANDKRNSLPSFCLSSTVREGLIPTGDRLYEHLWAEVSRSTFLRIFRKTVNQDEERKNSYLYTELSMAHPLSIFKSEIST